MSTILPLEFWHQVIDVCPNLESLTSLSTVNNAIGKKAQEILLTIKENKTTLVQLFSSLQDLYCDKYQTIKGPGKDVRTLSNQVLVEITSLKNGKIENSKASCCKRNLIEIFENQILINLTFGKEELAKYLPENNPSYLPFGIGLASQAYSIAQDRLPIRKLEVCQHPLIKPHLLISVQLAEKTANDLFYTLNGTYADTASKWIWG